MNYQVRGIALRLTGEPDERKPEVREISDDLTPDPRVESAASAMVHGAVGAEGITAPSRGARMVVPAEEGGDADVQPEQHHIQPEPPESAPPVDPADGGDTPPPDPPEIGLGEFDDDPDPDPEETIRLLEGLVEAFEKPHSPMYDDSYLPDMTGRAHVLRVETTTDGTRFEYTRTDVGDIAINTRAATIVGSLMPSVAEDDGQDSLTAVVFDFGLAPGVVSDPTGVAERDILLRFTGEAVSLGAARLECEADDADYLQTIQDTLIGTRDMDMLPREARESVTYYDEEGRQYAFAEAHRALAEETIFTVLVNVNLTVPLFRGRFDQYIHELDISEIEPTQE